MNCPCHNCICVPVCRLKEYFHLVDDCALLLKLLYRGIIIDTVYRRDDYSHKIIEIHKELQPHHWEIKKCFRSNSFIQVWGINL